MKIGYFLSCEEWGPRAVVAQEIKARDAELVTEETVAEQVPCGSDADLHVEKITAFADAGFDELYVNQIGPDQDAFFEAYRQHVLPQLR